MLFKMTEPQYKPHPVLERALDVLFILHADHEQNCSTHAMRGIGSSHADPYSALAGAAAALYGPLHGGANEAVLRMLNEIGSIEHVPAFIKRVKGGEGRLMGFGHRVYKSYDPRAKIIKRMADLVFEVTGRNPLLDIALELERIALEDDYFVTRKLYPNVDFYSGLIYQAMGFPVDDVPGAVRHPAHRRLDRAVGGDAHRPGAEDRPAAADLPRVRQAGLRARDKRDRTATVESAAELDAAHSRSPRPACPVLGRSRCALRPVRAPPQSREAPRHFDGARALRDLRQTGGDRTAPCGVARRPADARVHQRSSSRSIRLTARNSRSTPRRRSARSRWSTCVATIPGPAQRGRLVIGGHYDTKLSRDVHVRRRERRRLEHRVPPGAGARAERAPQSDADRAPVSRRRGSHVGDWTSATDHTYGSQYYVDTAEARGNAEGHSRVHPGRHDRRPRPADQTRSVFDALADRLDLGGGRDRLKRPSSSDESTPIEDDHVPFLEAGVAGGRSHRPRLSRLAHARRHARQGQRRLARSRRRGAARGAAGDRKAAAEIEFRRQDTG